MTEGVRLQYLIMTPYGVRHMDDATVALYDRAAKRVNGLPDRRTREGKELAAIYRRVRDEARAEFEAGGPRQAA